MWWTDQIMVNCFGLFNIILKPASKTPLKNYLKFLKMP